ncbi:MAG: bifunctional transaldolase/phosoglucose isomerase [Alphaproteobacteria bacterium]|nr:bifunctional transaldolase/phosoglucose isomerase [Alphaproteobacteria bacterium]
MSRLKTLAEFGQSVWLDFLTREMIESGDLAKRIAEDGITGMTSNPAIFEKAIGSGKEYDADIKRLAEGGAGVGDIFRALSVHDIRLAADAFAPVYARTKGADGFISLEVSPYIASDTEATLSEARALWQAVERPNLMIKVPATREGLPAIETLIGSAINVNITLLFSTEVYREVALAYIAGLEARPKGEDLSHIASVASFFVSRIDAKVDGLIDKKLQDANKEERGRLAGLAMLRGKIAIANAKNAYAIYKEIFSGPRWEALSARGARPQRLLWASTSTKNKAYSDVLYVDSLIGPNTVNTMPPETMEAFADHGTPKATIESGLEDAREQLAKLEDSGISLERVTKELVEEGVEKFAEAADKLYAALAAKRVKCLNASLVRISEHLGKAQDDIDVAIANWTRWGASRRLWARDSALWTNGDEAKWLGWLDIAARERAHLEALTAFRDEIDRARLSDVVLLGMGGSSLGAAVLAESFGQRQGWPRLHVLDSTDPDQIREIEKKIVPQATRFIVASKSGTTLEPSLLKDYFWDRAVRARGAAAAGDAFIAITDPGSALEKEAKGENFGHVFLGDPQIGGRFSVLSKFGLVPGTAMGLDLERFLDETQHMVTGCGPLVPGYANPGVRLGVVLGTLATKFGRDKVTILASEGLRTLGAWLEQLIAESTGKQGKGLIPVDRESPGDPATYGNDRVFVLVRLAGVDHGADVAALEEAGHPVLQIVAEDSYQLGQLFFLWEVAIAIAGSIIGINPFNQPDVEAAKVKARELTDAFQKTGTLPQSAPIYEQRGITLYADDANAEAIGHHDDLAGYLRAHFARLKEGDYAALLAFIEHCDAFENELTRMRVKLRDAKRVATCVGFGPRFLHSTGQAYKGGPDSGVFLEITGEPAEDLEVPGRKISFGMVERAQALGDFAVLNERGRRALRIHLKDVASGLSHLCEVFDAALS